tara:strand:+ start:39 stop:557 length:519 start_codon:yes stop_codon:yes gene_type:complete
MDIDFSKSKAGVMLCSLDRTIAIMPELWGVIEPLLPTLELDIDDYVFDVKVHMLMPETYPCIPNWHYDFLPRDCNGERCKGEKSNLKMYTWISGEPLTVYKNRDTGVEYTKPCNEWHSFTQHDLHRGDISKIHTWRCFIRVIPKSFIHSTTKNIGEERRHIQVYCDSSKFRW